MKKVNSFLCIFLSVLILSSCATLPKKVKENDTLVIGQIHCTSSGYKKYKDVEINGTYSTGIEMTVLDTITSREYKVLPDKEGYFYIKNLPTHHACCISFVKATRMASSGNGYYVSISIPPEQRKLFIPYKNQVVNLGTIDYFFDGSRNWVTWDYKGFSGVNYHFLNLDEDSEWLSKKIYEQ